MARKKCWNCKWAITGNSYGGTECNYAAHHEESRIIQAYRACGVDHATEETDRMLSGETCAFYEQGARVYRKIESVPLPGSNPKALTKEPKKVKHYDWERAREMLARGCGVSAIARALGCSLSSVKAWKQREGLQRPVPNWSKAAEMHREGACAREIAEAIGVKERTVQDWARRERIVFLNATDAPASQ